MNENKLIILSGPSCVGKTPLIKAFNNHYPKQAENLKNLVLYNSRLHRPYEQDDIDYHFRLKEEIEELQKKENFIVIDVRGDLQALDVTELLKQLESSDIYFEGNTHIAKILLQHELLKNINKLSIFLSPFSKDEILQLQSDLGTKEFQNYVFETMKTKIIRRAEKFKQELTDPIRENIDKRAADAYPELKDAWIFDYIIPNHDGEDSLNWDEPIAPESDAFLSVKEFSILLKKENQQISEKWKKTLFV